MYVIGITSAANMYGASKCYNKSLTLPNNADKGWNNMIQSVNILYLQQKQKNNNYTTAIIVYVLHYFNIYSR